MKIDSIDDVHRYLEAIPPFKKKGEAAADFSLDHFKKYCEKTGNPQDQFPSIHVAGSNGKGSTCQIIASIYHEAGYDVGVFTSPHLLSYKERFTINGKQISNDDLVKYFSSFRTLIERYKLTYFEVCTALAFWWFDKRNVDIAIIETGLGGRLDATNVITPLTSVITTITYDHIGILGETIAEITAEKAGIIKKKVPVVLGNIPDEARPVISKKAKEMHAPVYDSLEYHPEFNEDRYFLNIKGEQVSLQSSLKTPVQAYNIAVAWQVTEVLSSRLSCE